MCKQTSSVIAILLGFTAAAAAQTLAAQIPEAQGPTPPAQAGQTCPLPEIVDQAPLQQVSGSDLVTVPVTINGTTEQFLLDLGMTKPTRVSPELMAKLSLPQVSKLGGSSGSIGGAGTGMNGGASFGSSSFTGAGGMGMPYYDVSTGMGSWLLNTQVHVSSFGIGSATGRHLQMMVAPKGEIGRSSSFDGYLTGDFFRQYDVEVDFAEKQITWLTPTKCTDPNQAVFWAHHEVATIPISLAKDGKYQMRAMVQGHLINAEFDTSSPHTVMRRDIAEQDVGLKADTPKMIPAGDLKDGMGMQIYVSNFPEIIFAGGGVTAENVAVMIQDNSMIPMLDRHMNMLTRAPDAERIPDLVIGMDVLQHLHMYVVPGVGRLYVTSTE
jgi:hypothetical protein